MSLLGVVTRYLPFLDRKRHALPRAETLALRPLRNPLVTWKTQENEEGGAVLSVQRRQDKLGRLLARWLPLPPAKTIQLDEFGAAVWELCDGTHTVEQLVGHTCGRYKLNRRQGEVSVMAFMRMLAQRRLIGLVPAAFVSEGKGSSHGIERPAGAGGRKRIGIKRRPGGTQRRRY